MGNETSVSDRKSAQVQSRKVGKYHKSYARHSAIFILMSCTCVYGLIGENILLSGQLTLLLFCCSLKRVATLHKMSAIVMEKALDENATNLANRCDLLWNDLLEFSPENPQYLVISVRYKSIQIKSSFILYTWYV